MRDPAERLVMTVQATQGDALRVGMEMLRASRFAVVAGMAAVTIAAVSIGIGAPIDLTVIYSLAFGVLFLTGLFVVPFQWWAVRKRPELIVAPMKLEADDGGLTIAMGAVRSEMAWSTFKSFLEASGAFILQTGVTAHFIPKRGMTPDQERAFRVLLLRQHELTHAADAGRWLRRALVGVAVGAALVGIPFILASMAAA